VDDSQSVICRLTRALLASIALVLAIAGQITLYATPDGLTPGLVLVALGVLLFVWAGVRPPPFWLVRLVGRSRLSYRAMLIGLSVILSIMATVVAMAFDQLARLNYLPALILWGGSAMAYWAAFAIDRPFKVSWRTWFVSHATELAAIGAVTLIAAALRFYQLGAIPRVINGDEGLVGQAALLARQHPLVNPFTLFENLGGLYLQAINLALSAFGQTPFGLRFVPALGGTLAIPALYLLGRYLFGRRVAFWSACLLAVSHAQIHFSRTVAVAYLQGTWLIPLELYYFASGMEERDKRRLAIGGMILGVHFSVYLGAQVIAGLLLLYLLVAIWLCRPLVRQAGRAMLTFWFGAALIALPQFVYAWRHQGEFLARLNANGTFQSGWLAQKMAETGQNALQILAGRVAHAFLSLNYYPALDFYGTTIPILGPITGALFLLGVGYSLWRMRDRWFLLMNVYLWGGTLAVGVFAIPPSADSYRMLIVLPAAVVLAAVALEELLALLSLHEPGRRAARQVLLSLLILAVLTLNLRAYFIDFAGQCQYGGDPQTRFASYLGNYLRTLDRGAKVYLLSDDVFLYGTHSSVDFLSRGLPVTNWTASVNELKQGTSMAIVAPPSRVDELLDWADNHPGGKLHREYDCDKLMLLAYFFP
jgi:4-amino-4-deoxy-L-arabinose transferase-like glycosyltransferase